MVGRKKKSLIDVMRTRLWLAEMMRVAGAANLNQFGELLEDVDTKKLLYRYASGEHGVSKKKLDEIDAWCTKSLPDYVSRKPFFNVGPPSRHGSLKFAPLWDALDGSMEKVWEVLVCYDDAIAVQKCLGVSFRLRSSFLVYRVFNEIDPPAVWEDLSRENCVAQAYRSGELAVDADLVTVAIASWRMAHFTGDCIPMMNYILIGLLDRAIPETMESLCQIKLDRADGGTHCTLTENLLDFLEALDRRHVAVAEDAIKDLNYDAPVYPVTEWVDGQVEDAGYEQPFDFGYLINQVKRSSVCEFLARRRCARHEQAGSDSACMNQPPAPAIPSVRS